MMFPSSFSNAHLMETGLLWMSWIEGGMDEVIGGRQKKKFKAEEREESAGEGRSYSINQKMTPDAVPAVDLYMRINHDLSFTVPL